MTVIFVIRSQEVSQVSYKQAELLQMSRHVFE